ncbi:MAG: UDP-N-acetylmuramoyl-tripeptide--D-alanyl-D-alanine ligase [Opitutaceae bacterium]|nr:UDP-N-acetylmuramoyl-tripeptide--D-alanyl-D-alanine ligase [Opitutaceae bacterium]MBP9912391.1 UDP-N-acetylmuramoyl-tripeptide--D-alanyl-D-alanine ligase [Opitutaceae bacterium]
MTHFNSSQLAAWTGGRWTAPPVLPLTGFTVDTRQLHAGQVFIALKTEKRDGHDFLNTAQAAGASAAIVATANPALPLPQLVVADPLAAFQAIAREHRRTFRGPVVGISGSAGKTSTKNLLALLLGGETGGVLATEGNLNNHIGVPLTLTRLDPAVHKFAVIEAGISAPGEMAPLAAMIEPDVALNTLVAAAHTAALGGLEGVAREKALLPAVVRPAGVAIFPKQSGEFAAFRALDVRQMVIEPAEVIRPDEPPKDKVYFAVTQRGDSTAIALAYGPPPPLVFTLRRVSDGMAQNAVLAICAALWLGVPRDQIQARLATWQPAKLRGEIRHEAGRLLYLDCYNANPAAMADALATFHAIAPAVQPRLYVIGCMEELGADSSAQHRALGRALQLRAEDRLFVIGGQAHEVGAGVLEQGDFTRQMQLVSTLDPVAACYADWRGAVFLKGSRRYQLETILEPASAVPAHA